MIVTKASVTLFATLSISLASSSKQKQTHMLSIQKLNFIFSLKFFFLLYEFVFVSRIMKKHRFKWTWIFRNLNRNEQKASKIKSLKCDSLKWPFDQLPNFHKPMKASVVVSTSRRFYIHETQTVQRHNQAEKEDVNLFVYYFYCLTPLSSMVCCLVGAISINRY